MNLNNVDLILTAGLTSQLPGVMSSDIPHVAFCGRSNVGKSSLINKLLGRKKLARVSSEPGKTITINCYDIDGQLYLVDLPGYGYAKRSFSEREKWKSLIDKYFSVEAQRLYLQLVDLKVGLTKDDEEMLKFLIIEDLPFAIVATKADKLNQTNRKACLERIEKHELVPEDAVVIPFSALTGEGVEEIWTILNEFCSFIKENTETEDSES
jgi:ribosome biogenesis GTP-binding protein YsxC/EngB